MSNMICHTCEKLVEVKEAVRDFPMTSVFTIKKLNVLVCSCCDNNVGVKGIESRVVKEAIDAFKAIRPEFERVINEVPLEQRDKWISHLAEDGDIAKSCDCNEKDKGANCNGVLTKFLYDKTDWLRWRESIEK